MSIVNFQLDLLRKNQVYMHSNMQPIHNCYLFRCVAASTFSTSFFVNSLPTCGSDLKNYAVADLRLQTSRITKLRTCGCGLRKLKFGCGVANCGRKKKLWGPPLDGQVVA